MEDLPVGLARKDTFAALSASDLEELGKRASDMYLCEGTPLNEAICKIAEEKPSISTHQVRRIIEFANQNTFQRLFEKQAGDKNIEFPVADPSVVLKHLDAGARGHIMTPAPDEYSMEPEKTASMDIEADIAIMREFGLEPSSAAMEKAAQGPLMGGPMTQGPSAQAGGMSRDEVHHQQMLDISRGIELEKKKQELVTTQRKTMDIMQGTTPASQGQGGGGGGMGGQGMQQAQAPQAPEPTSMEPQQKMASALVDRATQYVKVGRQKAAFVLDDLKNATSLERIRDLTEGTGKYAESNPFGELIRTRQEIEKLAEDASHAYHKNADMIYEASEKLAHEVGQHMLSGGEFGEVAVLMGAVSENEQHIKLAMDAILPGLRRKGIEAVTIQAQTLKYEMEKGAQARVPNPEHTIVQSYATLVKLADSGRELEVMMNELKAGYDELTSVLSKVAARHHAASR